MACRTLSLFLQTAVGFTAWCSSDCTAKAKAKTAPCQLCCTLAISFSEATLRGHTAARCMPAGNTQCGKKQGAAWWACVWLPAVQGGVLVPGTLQVLSEGPHLSVQRLLLALGGMLCTCQLQPQPLSLLQTCQAGMVTSCRDGAASPHVTCLIAAMTTEHCTET